MPDSSKLPFTIGLTGGIGSGKSLVSGLFSELGVPIIDTDQISRDLVLHDSKNLQLISAHFGATILQTSGELDRAKLRQIIFKDPLQKQWLEALLHPQIRTAAIEQLTACKSGYAMLVVPLLLESDRYAFVDRILVIDCPEELQLQRVMDRDNCSLEVAKKILQAQIPRQQRLARADDIIENSGTLNELKQKVLNLHEKYKALSRSGTH